MVGSETRAPNDAAAASPSMVWFAALDFRLELDKPLPLVLLRPPCTYRKVMFTMLDTVRQEWLAACTVSSLMGVQAAVAGGLGITALGRSFIQDGMQILPPPPHWPRLPMTEIVVLGNDTAEKTLAQPLLSFLVESLQVSLAISRAPRRPRLGSGNVDHEHAVACLMLLPPLHREPSLRREPLERPLGMREDIPCRA